MLFRKLAKVLDNGCNCELGQPNRLYRNDNGQLTTSAVWSSTESDRTTSVAWGDYDGDGDLDLAVGNGSQPNRLYRNDNGQLTTSAVWSSTESDATFSVAWGDYDGDGDLDLAVGNYYQPNRLRHNDNGTLTLSAVWSSTESDDTRSVAWGDYDGDGDLDLAVGNYGQPNRLYRNGTAGAARLLNNSSQVTLNATRHANFYVTPLIQGNPIIPLTYTVSDPEGDPVRFIRAYYSPDGGGKWYTTTAASGTITRDLTTTLGYALNMTGSAGYVQITNSAGLNITNELTLEAWVKLNNSATDQKVVGKTPIGAGYLLGVGNGMLYPEIWDSTSTRYFFLDGNVITNQWTHLAVTWKTGGQMIGYINGTPVQTVTASVNPIGVSSIPFIMGAATWDTNAFRLNGFLDDVRLYRRTLSADEIQMTMREELRGNETGLVGYWRF